MRALLLPGRSALAAAALVAVCGLALVEAWAGGRILMDAGLLLASGSALAAGLWSRTAWTCVAVLVGAALMTAASQVADPGAYALADDAVFSLLVLGCPALVGAGWSARRRQIRELRRLSVVRAEQVAAEVETARIGETNRIAGRVQQDVVQTLGAILVLAEGALGSGVDGGAPPGDRDPTRRSALAAIERSARDALDQLREHVGWLRGTADGHPPTSPAPTGREGGGSPRGDVDDPPGTTGPSARPGLSPLDLLAALAAVPVSVEVAVTDHASGPTWAAVLAPLALAWPLAQRRRRPVAAVVAYVALALAISLLLVRLDHMVTPILPMLLVGFAVGAGVRSWDGRLVAALLLAGGTAALAATHPAGVDVEALSATLVVLAVAAAAGAVSAASAARVQTLDALVRAIERHRDHEVALATARQRQAVARDLHDSVASAATIICLQAGAAQTVPAGDAGVAEALQTVAATAREAVREIRTSLELVHGGRPGPGAADVEDVVATARRAGVDAALHTSVPVLPGPVDEAVVRVVREAIVNASRHAPGAHVVVSLERDGGDVVVRVSDDGPGRLPSSVPSSGEGTGTGLTGLAERLALLGGVLSHGPVGPGYEVRARLPLGGAARDAAGPVGLVAS